MDIKPLPMSTQTAQRVDYWLGLGDPFRAIAQFIKDEGYVKSETVVDAPRMVLTESGDIRVEGVVAERNRIAALIRDAAADTKVKATKEMLEKLASIVQQE